MGEKQSMCQGLLAGLTSYQTHQNIETHIYYAQLVQCQVACRVLRLLNFATLLKKLMPECHAVTLFQRSVAGEQQREACSRVNILSAAADE